MKSRLLRIVAFSACATLWSAAGARVEAQDDPSLASAAMRTLFNPSTAPRRKTMGLLQRNFLDVAGQTGDLEVAIVVDGTESMGKELAGVRASANRMIADLQRLRGGDGNRDRVRVTLVIYRDSGSPSGEVEIPLPTFTSQPDEIEAALQRLTPESGAPFYHELMDVGVHQAITNLPWNEDPTVSKWILLFGDAPPYDLSYHDEAFPKATRRFADELLVSLASRRGIQIHCVLCDSTEETQQSHVESRNQTRQVMDRLASQTGGMVLDLSYPAIREALAGQAPQPDIQFTPIAPITGKDLASKAQTVQALSESLRLAVLPHDQLESLDFSPDQAGMQVATALNQQFRILPGIRIKSAMDVERQVRRLRAEGLVDAEAIRGLAARLGVDYVLWGRLKEKPAITSVAFRRRDNQAVVQVAYDGSPDGLAEVMLTAASQNPNTDDAFVSFAKQVLQGKDERRFATLSSQSTTLENLLTAIGCLEQTLGLSIGSEDSDRLLAQGKAATARVLQSEPANPMGNWLLANILFNQASAAFQRADTEFASAAMKDCRSALRLADRHKSDLRSDAMQLEIEADYRLIVRKEYDEAIKLYTRMTNPSQPEDTQARGHWMLSGLYAGDWGIDPTRIDPRLAREHVVAILSLWPDRPEAALLQRWLQWDQETQTTRHNHLPRLNDVLAGLQ